MNQRLKSIVVPSLLSLVALIGISGEGPSANESVPEITETAIRFSGGGILQYHRKKILHSKPSEALKSREPVSISEKPVLIMRWKRLVLVRTIDYFEGGAKEIMVYDYKGNALIPPRRIMGEVFFLENTNRIFLGQTSAHFRVDKSFLLDQDGNLVREIPQPETVWDFGSSADGRIIWIISHHIKAPKNLFPLGDPRNLIPLGRLKVLDSDGVEIKTIEFLEEKTIEVQHNSNIYKIHVKAPKIPG